MKSINRVFFFGFLIFLISCSESTNTESKVAKGKEESKHKSIVKNEVQVGDSTMIYKVSLGVLPDLGYTENGMKISKVYEGKPGFKGGLKDNDIIIEMDGTPIKNLVEYTKFLMKHKKGDSVKIIAQRGEDKVKLEITFD